MIGVTFSRKEAKDECKEAFESLSWTELAEYGDSNKGLGAAIAPALLELAKQAFDKGYTKHDMGCALIIFGLALIRAK